jgi:hypothetical protein
MATVTFQVLEGIDKGRVFRDMPIPLTIGREEGNVLRLNDERVSRFHAKVQQDNGDFILTDLESTNGTRVNGNTVQIRRLLAGDRVGVGRSLLLFGSGEQIAARMASLAVPLQPSGGSPPASPGFSPEVAAALAQTLAPDFDQDRNFDLSLKSEITVRDDGSFFCGRQQLPPLPQKMTPGQAARLAEILDFLHRGLSIATEGPQFNADATDVVLSYGDWQKVLAVQMLLARYLRAVAEPDALEE